MKLKTFTVTKVNQLLSNYVSENPIFNALSITGEVIDYKETNYGYNFLSLKDEQSRIRAMVFTKTLGDIKLKDGDVITAVGKISFYSRYGTYTFLVNKLEVQGIGYNFEQFAKLYKELAALGYFEESRKKPLPKYPNVIGVVTSTTGAALQDIRAVIIRRYPKITMLVCHAKMQGDNVDVEVADAIHRLEKLGVDTIILSRGGGDADDLAAFNSKLIADTIYNSDVPIISAIGHEIDFSISDFVADKRAATPSIAAEISVPDISEVIKNIDDLKDDITQSFNQVLQNYKLKVSFLEKEIKLGSPSQKIYEKKMMIKDLQSMLNSRFTTLIYSYKQRLQNIEKILSSSDYSKVLEKGFAMVKKDGKIIQSADELLVGDDLLIEFMTGSASATVNNITKGR